MEFRSSKAIYLQIADRLMCQILSKIWNEKDRLPSMRKVAVETETHPNTVMRTYSYLQQLEIIHSKRGLGYFVNKGAFEKTKQIKKEEFINIDLPHIFKTMSLLEMGFLDLENLYQSTYKQRPNENE